ncbi:hypothetical protein ACE2AK_22605 [Rahnella perminowiae]|nr:MULTISPECIES: hypothetical protein [Rahnella]MCR8998542.1 hypothetical protein [Rahnella perminowiae]
MLAFFPFADAWQASPRLLSAKMCTGDGRGILTRQRWPTSD